MIALSRAKEAVGKSGLYKPNQPWILFVLPFLPPLASRGFLVLFSQQNPQPQKFNLKWLLALAMSREFHPMRIPRVEEPGLELRVPRWGRVLRDGSNTTLGTVL